MKAGITKNLSASNLSCPKRRPTGKRTHGGTWHYQSVGISAKDGRRRYIIHLDMGDIQEMIRLLRICSNNLNQYTRRANETGNIYAADIEDIRTRLDSLWDGMDKLIRGFANIS